MYSINFLNCESKANQPKNHQKTSNVSIINAAEKINRLLCEKTTEEEILTIFHEHFDMHALEQLTIGKKIASEEKKSIFASFLALIYINNIQIISKNLRFLGVKSINRNGQTVHVVESVADGEISVWWYIVNGKITDIYISGRSIFGELRKDIKKIIAAKSENGFFQDIKQYNEELRKNT